MLPLSVYTGIYQSQKLYVYNSFPMSYGVKGLNKQVSVKINVLTQLQRTLLPVSCQTQFR